MQTPQGTGRRGNNQSGLGDLILLPSRKPLTHYEICEPDRSALATLVCAPRKDREAAQKRPPT